VHVAIKHIIINIININVFALFKSQIKILFHLTYTDIGMLTNHVPTVKLTCTVVTPGGEGVTLSAPSMQGNRAQ